MEFEELLARCRSNGRVCPTPKIWDGLWKMLPDRKRGAGGDSCGWTPGLPLVLSAWWSTSDLAKRERLTEHLEWARDHGALQAVSAMLLSLPDEDWHSDHQSGERDR